MANLHKFTVQEALNAGGAGGNWTVTSKGTAGSVGSDGGTVHYSVSSGVHQLGIYSDVAIRFKFQTSDTDIDVSEDNELKLPDSTLVFLTVPRGLGNTIYFSYVSNSTTTGSVRIVEV